MTLYEEAKAKAREAAMSAAAEVTGMADDGNEAAGLTDAVLDAYRSTLMGYIEDRLHQGWAEHIERTGVAGP